MATAVESSVLPQPTSVEEMTFTLEDDTKLLKELSNKPYKQQAIWFLNAYWKVGPCFGDNVAEAEYIWKVVDICISLDSKSEEGNELNEFDAHRLLEKLDLVLTVKEMRDVLRKIDLDFNKFVSLTEFLVYKYNVSWRELVHAPQGGVDEAKLSLAQQKVDEAKEDIKISEVRAGEAKIAEKESIHAELQAKKSETEAVDDEKAAVDAELQAKESEKSALKSEESARERESEAFREETLAKEAETKAVKAEEEQLEIEKQVRECLETVEREEKAFHDKCQELEDTGNDDSKGIVARNKAKAELAQLKSCDPMPLQRAKISQEAVVRRQERATKSAAAAKIAAQTSRAHSEEARGVAVKAREAAEEAANVASSRRRKAEHDAEKAKESRHEATEKRKEAEDARRHSEKFRLAAEQALEKSTESYQAAVQYLAKVKRECQGAGKGKLWWMDRELEESKKYMSKAQLAKLEAAPPLNQDITPSCA